MTNHRRWPVIFFILIAHLASSSDAVCYFPQKYQGEFVMQGSGATVGNDIQYSTVNITETAIPIWGSCHRKIGNKFILMVIIAETSCFRCVHLKLRSSNVLQVFITSQQTISQCYTNEETAEENCPSETSLFSRDTAEILFFKTRDFMGEPTTKEYCPIDGKYTVTYKGNELGGVNSCSGLNSSVNSCPAASSITFNLQGCPFDHNMFRFDCLGHWKGPNDNYLTFIDSRHKIGLKPKYRCALYKRHPVTGIISMAVSSDSTCTADLFNSTSGYETFTLIPKPENPWPDDVAFSMCTFPKWMRGNWEHATVDENTLVYKDHSSFKTYTIKCAVEQEGGSKYLIFSRTQCDEERYNCMRVAKRSNNILEFQLGTKSSSPATGNNKDFFALCSDENFLDENWITQGRLDIYPEMVPGMCPITGEYAGTIPDATELCAKLWSDCRAPELMYYQVSLCETGEVVEEREYQCLGHWKESDLLYTYTQRRDIAAGTYECFVGSIISDKEINIREAGEHCQRHMDPMQHGMRLNKKSLYSCISQDNVPRPSTHKIPTTAPIVPKYTHSTPPTKPTTMKHWNFDNTIPGSNNDNNQNTGNISKTISFTTVLYIALLSYVINV